MFWWIQKKVVTLQLITKTNIHECINTMKIGDKVRFLSEVGGGRVAGFQGRDIVLVEDEDGFQVPMRTSEVVVIGEEDYGTTHMVDIQRSQYKQQAQEELEEEETEPADKPVTFKAAPVERKGGELLSAYLAFVPIDPKELTMTRFEAYFVNDSNYYLRYALMGAEGTRWTVKAVGEAEPNTKELVLEFGRDELDSMEHLCVQAFAYKKEKPFLLKQTVNAQLHVDPMKFYKLHTFRENDFFEQPALVYTIVENDVQKIKL